MNKKQQNKPQELLSNCCGASAKGGEDYDNLRYLFLKLFPKEYMILID